MQAIHPPITPANANTLQYLCQLGWYDNHSYPKQIHWHPTAPIIALTYPLIAPVDTVRLALWNAVGTCLSIITSRDGEGKGMLWSPVGWSADGLVFAYGFTHIHVSTADQRSSRTLPGQSLRWSPHGHTLATSDMVSVALWDLDRGITTVLPDSGGIRLGWSPAFCWANTTTVRGATDTLITTWDVNGTIITQHPLAPAFSTDSIFARPIPMWSPDGNLLATWIDHEVAIVGHDGTPHAIVPTSTMGAFASPVA